MANGGTITFGVKYNVDQSGLNSIKKNLQEMQKMTTAAFSSVNKGMGGGTAARQELLKVKETAQQVENAMERAFNPNLNTYNLTQLNKELNKIGIDKIYRDFQKMGAAGQSAFRGIVTQIATTNQQIKQSHKLIDDFAKTMGNTIKWGITSSIMNTFTGSVEKAYGYVKNLNSSLNDIRIVTGQSAEEMEKFSVKANNAAKALGASTLDYTKASLIYYQQGLSEEEVAARAEVTLKAANVTGQSGEEVSEQLTAVWNGYKVSAQEAELYIDKVAAVAAATAADLEELSTGMSKVASAANAMGVDVDQLNAQLATIVSVTRQAPESVGTALKTIYARMSDLKLGGKDEDGIGLGDVSGTMEKMGVAVLDETGNLRDMGLVIEEVAAKWATWTEAQQTAMAQVMAGKRQYNNLVALFENWDMYTDALETSQTAAGTLEEQNQIYLESTEAHLKQLATAAEDVYNSMFNAESFNDLIDLGTGLVTVVGDFIEAIGGGGTALTALGGIATRVFSKNIAEGLQTTIANLRVSNSEIDKVRLQTQFLQQTMAEMNRSGKNDAVVTEVVNQKMDFERYDSLMTPEMQSQVNQGIQNYSQALDQQDIFKKNKQAAEDYLRTIKSLGPALIDLGDSSIDEQQYAFQDALVEVDTALKNLVETTEQYRDEMSSTFSEGEAENVLKNISNSFETLSSTIEVSDENTRRYEEAMQELAEAMKEGDVNKQQTAYKKLSGIIHSLSQSYSEASKNANKFVEMGGSKVGTEMAQMANQAQVAKQQLDALKQKLSEISKIQTFTEVIGSIGQVASAIQSISAIPDIWENNDLTEGEKVLQTIISLGFALPMLANGFKTLKTDLNGTIRALIAEGAALATNTVAQNENAEAAKNNGNTRNDLAEDIQENVSKIAQDTTEEVVEETTENLGKKFNGKDLAKGVGKKLLSGLKSTLSFLKAFGLPLAAIAASITAITLATKAQERAYEDAKKAAESARNSANALKTAYEQTKNKLDDLNNSLENFKNVQTNLDNLVQGTEEWREALFKSNKEITQLISTYPEIAKFFSSEGGTIQLIDESGLRTFLKEQENLVDFQHRASLLATQQANNAEIQLDTTELKKDIEIFDSKTNATIMGGFAMVGGVIGSIIPVFGTAIGTAAGAAIGIAVGTAIGGISAAINEANDVSDQHIKTLIDAYKQDGINTISSIEAIQKTLSDKGISISEKSAEAIYEARDKIIALSDRLEANTKAQEINNQYIAQQSFSVLGDEYEKSGYKDLITNYAGKLLSDSSQLRAKKGELVKDQEDKEKIKEVYANIAGYEYSGKDDVYYELDENGKPIKNNEILIDFEQVLTIVAADSLMQDLVNSFGSLEQALYSLEEAIGKGGLKILFGSSEDLKNITEEEFVDFFAGTGYKAGQTFSELENIGAAEAELKYQNQLQGWYIPVEGDKSTLDYIKLNEQIRDMFPKIDLEELGYDNYLLWFIDYKDKIDAAALSYEDLMERKFAFEKSGLIDGADNKKVIDVSDMTHAQLDQLEKDTSNAFKYLGETGRRAFVDTIGNVVDSDSEGLLMSLVGKVDWSSITYLQDFYNLVKKSSIAAELSEDEIVSLAEAYRELALAAQDSSFEISSIRTAISSISSIAGNLQIGGIISDEDYLILKQYNKELDKYFVLTAEGYRFIGGDFKTGSLAKDLVSQFSGGSIQDWLESAEKKKAAIEKINTDTDYSVEVNAAIEKVEEGEAFDVQTFLSDVKLSDQEIADILGVSQDWINSVFDEGDTSRIKSIFSELDSYLVNYGNKMYETQQVEELWASANIESLSELSAAYKTNLISAKTYFKTKSIIIQNELNDLEISTEAYQNYVNQLKEVYPELGNVKSGVEEVALANMEANQGLNTLNDNWENWIYKFDQFGKGTPQYAANLANMQTSLAQLLNVDKTETIDANFIDKNRQLIYDIVVSGDIDKLDELQKRYAKEQLVKINVEIPNSAYGSVDDLVDSLDEELNNLEVGEGLSENFSSVLTQMLLNSSEAADDILNIFTQMGIGVSEALPFMLAVEQAGGAQKFFARADLLKSFGINSSVVDHSGMTPDELVDWYLRNNFNTTREDLVSGEYPGLFKMPEVEDSLQLDDDGDKGGGSDWEKDTNLKDTDKKTEAEYDRYHDVNIEIQKQVDLLEKLKEQEDELVGQAYLDNLQEQNKALEKQNEWIEEKIRLKKEEAAELRTELEGQGIAFDEEGDISNYLSMMKDLVEKINDAQTEVNEASEAYNEAANETEEKNAQDRIDFAQGELDKLLEQYEWLKKLIEKYEQIQHEDLVQLEAKQESNIDKMISNEIESLNYSIDVDLDLADAERQWNEFKWKVLDKGSRFSLFGENILGEAEMLMENLRTYPDSVNGLMNQVQKYMNIINGGGQFEAGADMKQAIENAEKYRDELMETMESIEDAIQQIQQLYLDMIDAAKDAFDDHIAQYELVNEILEHNISLIETLDGEDSYNALSNYYDEIEANNNANLKFQREQVEFWKSRMDAEEYGSEAWLKYKENWQDAMSELNSTVESSVDNLIAKYQNTVSSIMADLTASLTGNKFGLDYLEKEWTLLNENADMYLDKINGMFAIDQLESKYMDAINSTDNLQSQERLTQIMNEQVAALEKKEKLTQYDVDRANLMYEIELKKIALEEAQANKSKMRLRRDSQGNYSYQFTADEDAVGQAEQDLAAAQNSLYNLDKEAYRDNLQQIYDTYAAFEAELKELYADQTLSEEEREAKRQLIVEKYGETINGLVANNENIRTNLYDSTFQELARMYNTDIEHFQNMSQAEQDLLMQEMVPQWDSGIQTMIDKIAAEGGFGFVVAETLQNLEKEHSNYEKDLEEMADAAGIELDAIRGGYDTVHESVEGLIEQSEGELMDTWDQQLDKMQALVDSLEAYDDALDSTRDAVGELIEALNDLIAKQQEADAGKVTPGDDNTTNTSSENNTPASTGGSSGAGSSSTGRDGDSSSFNLSKYSQKEKGVALAIHALGDKGGWYNGSTRMERLNEKKVSKAQEILNAWYDDKITAAGNFLGTYSNWDLDKYKYGAFRTGGYTGAWVRKVNSRFFTKKNLF